MPPKKDNPGGGGGGPKRDKTAPTITGPISLTVDENQIGVASYSADEAIAAWAILGDDAALFSISAEGVVTFRAAPDFESPQDSDGNNVYTFDVLATDSAGNTSVQTVTVTVADVDEADVVAPTISGQTSVSMDENQTIVAAYLASEAGTWSLSGADAELFEIDASGNLAFRAAPDFEAPTDTDVPPDGVYEVTVELTDAAGNTGALGVSVTVTDVDEEAPTITVGPTALSVPENQIAVATYAADEAGTWSLTGQDAGAFEIDQGGVLTFSLAPDFEAPGDAGGDGTYEVTVQITDAAGNTGQLDVAVTLEDVAEPPENLGYGRIVIFGDSLSDNGNFSALAGNFLKVGYGVPFQYDGSGVYRSYDDLAFSDGTAYSDTLAGLLSLVGSYENHAFGGAQALGQKLGSSYIQKYSNLTYTKADGTTGTFSIVDEAALSASETDYAAFDINLGAQVDRFLAAYPGGVPDGTLAVLNIGANDLGEFDTSFFNILLGGVNAFADDLGAEIEYQSRRLVAAGVDGIALYRLPVAEFFIGYDDLNWLEKPLARDLIDTVNIEISAVADALNADGIATQVVRLDRMSEELLRNMETYGFAFEGPYFFGTSGDPDWVETDTGFIEPVFEVNAAALQFRADQILFFDEIHPSAALHDMLAIFSSETLTAAEHLGTSGSDTINLSSDDDFVLARDGSDTVNLGAGDDVALGGRGADTLRGEAGSDLLVGGRGNDVLEGGAGSDVLAGSLGTDLMDGGDGSDILIGGTDGDILIGGAGADYFIFIDPDLSASSGALGGEIIGDEFDTLFVVLAETLGAAVGDILEASDFGFLGLTVSGVTNYVRLDFAALDTLVFDDAELQTRYEEAQHWGIA